MARSSASLSRGLLESVILASIDADFVQPSAAPSDFHEGGVFVGASAASDGGTLQLDRYAAGVGNPSGGHEDRRMWGSVLRRGLGAAAAPLL